MSFDQDSHPPLMICDPWWQKALSASQVISNYVLLKHSEIQHFVFVFFTISLDQLICFDSFLQSYCPTTLIFSLLSTTLKKMFTDLVSSGIMTLIANALFIYNSFLFALLDLFIFYCACNFFHYYVFVKDTHTHGMREHPLIRWLTP